MVAFLRSQRRCRRAHEVRGANGTQSRSEADANASVGKQPRPPGLAKSGSLSDTYAWNAQGVDIGAVLGVDIGGTLSKLVYFEKKAPSAAQSLRRPSEDPMGKKVRRATTVSIVVSVAYTAAAE